MHINNERMLQILKQFSLMLDRFNTLLHDNLPFMHFLHCIELIGPFSLDLPNLPKSSSADDVKQFEVRDVDV